MKTILAILTKAGGWQHGLHLHIDNPPYMPLVIEAADESGPCGLPAISVCHYGEQNGDAMRDPEMCFEMEIEDGKLKSIAPYYYRNDYVGREEFAHDQDNGAVNARTVQNQQEFADLWGHNLKEQGFLRGYPETTI